MDVSTEGSKIKALVLAGGTGSRLRPITYTSAKQLVPIANKPILFYGLESIANSGVTEVGVIVGDTRAEVMEALGDGSRFGLKITYIPQDKPLGLAHCVVIAQDFLGDDDFVMYLGDNFILSGIDDFVQAFRDRTDGTCAQILLARVPDPQRFGVAELDEFGRVLRLVEKPAVPPSDLALVGVYLFDKSIHDAVRSIYPSARNELEITDAIDYLITQGRRVESRIVEGYWKDLGEPEALLEGNRLALEMIAPMISGTVDSSSRIEGRVVIELGAQVRSSLVRGPAIIGAGAVIEESFVGPYTAIGQGCVITRSEVENSIILNESRVSDIVRMEGSIIGKRAVVGQRRSLPSASRLVIGDNSTVEFHRG